MIAGITRQSQSATPGRPYLGFVPKPVPTDPVICYVFVSAINQNHAFTSEVRENYVFVSDIKAKVV